MTSNSSNPYLAAADRLHRQADAVLERTGIIAKRSDLRFLRKKGVAID